MNYLIHSHKNDYYKEVYKCIRKVIPDKNLLLLPHESDEYINSLPIIDNSNIVFVLSKDIGSSFGSGVEVGYAASKGKTIITLAESGSKISKSLQAVSSKIIYYKSLEELSKVILNLISTNTIYEFR